MSSTQPTCPQQICEDILKAGKQYNIEHGIWPSENAIVDRLLGRRVELTDAYEELHKKLHRHPPALKVFLDLLVSTVAGWSPDEISKSRAAREKLGSLNEGIARTAAALANLLDERSELHNASGFTSDTHYHVCKVLEAASEGNYRFQSFILKPLRALSGQYDLKYWPSLSDFLRVIASDAENADTQATDTLTAAATVAARSSQADFFKALFVAIAEESAESYGQLPRGFRATDSTLASLVNCALDLGPDELVDGPYVKRLRQREREGTI